MEVLVIKKLLNILVSLLLCFLCFCLTINNVKASALENEDEKIYANAEITDSFSSDSILVVLNDKASLDSKSYKAKDFDDTKFRSVDDLNLTYNELKEKNSNKLDNYNRVLKLELKTKTKRNVLDTIDELMKREDVLYAGPDYILEIASSTTTPNDYDSTTQWAIESLQLPEAWNYVHNSSVVVGVIDSWIDGDHPDLEDNIYFNKCIDYIDGYTTATRLATDVYTDKGHGTKVAGIIGAIGNNEIGVTGVCWNVSLVSLRTFNESGQGKASDVAYAINYAQSNGIYILNLSARWYSDWDGYDPALESVIESYSGLVVCCAGNEGIDNDGDNPAYPACYDFSNLITVGALNSDLSRRETSNYGLNSVDIYALGTNIYTTTNDGRYGSDSGTSFSAPFVTGVAALLLSINSDLTASQLKAAILNSAETITITIPDGSTQNVKKLNALNAVEYVISNYSSIYNLSDDESVTLSKSISGTSYYYSYNTIMLKLNVQDAYDYTFKISSSYSMKIVIYDSNFNQVYTKTTNNAAFSTNLSAGTYYLRINFVSEVETTEVSINISYGTYVHTHTYDSWIYYNRISHIECCSCGATGSETEVHYVKASEIKNNKAKCLGCNKTLDLTSDMAMTCSNNTKYSINGSYILPSGIIVLVDEDMDAYNNGILEFYNSDELLE